MASNEFYISNIKIKKLFGYCDIDWNLKPDVNILGGINGSGKTTILRCIYSILSKGELPKKLAETVSYIEITFINQYKIIWKSFKSIKEESVEPIIDENNQTFNLPSIKKEIVIHDCRLYNSERHEVSFSEYRSKWKTSLLDTIEHELISSDVAKKLGNEDIRTNLDVLLYNEIAERNSRLADNMERSRKMANSRLFDVVDPVSFFEKNYKGEIANEDINEAFKELEALNKLAVSDAISTLSAKMRNEQQTLIDGLVQSYMLDVFVTLTSESNASVQNTHLRIYDLLDTFFSSTGKKSLQSNKFEFECAKTNNKINYLYLSSGEKQLFLLFLKLFNSIGEKTIFFMDEPDAGMHIDWKEKLIKTMREINPDVQLIITTHSPSMIEGWFEHVKEIGEISHNA